MRIFGLLGCLLSVNAYYTSWCSGCSGGSFGYSPQIRSSVNNCSGRCCSGWGQGKSGSCSRKVSPNSGFSQMSSIRPQFQPVMKTPSRHSYRSSFSSMSPQIQVVQPMVMQQKPVVIQSKPIVIQPKIVKPVAVKPAKNIGKAWGSNCVHCNQNVHTRRSPPTSVHTQMRRLTQPQRGCQSPTTRVGSSCRMLTGPSSTAGQVKTANCFRVGGCGSDQIVYYEPVVAQQDQYEVAQYNEYDTGMERRRKSAGPRIDLSDDYVPATTTSYDTDASYDVSCIDCDDQNQAVTVMDAQYVASGRTAPAQIIPQPEQYMPPKHPEQGERAAHRNRGWSNWNSWGSQGSEYHESEGYNEQRSTWTQPFSNMYARGQQLWGTVQNLGSEIGKYSYSMGCFYYSC